MHKLSNEQWVSFFYTCCQVLGVGRVTAEKSDTRCAWTTFCMLESDLKYWVSGLPNIDDIALTGIMDGGVWGQPFPFEEIAHIIVPKKFCWYGKPGPTYQEGEKLQDIEALSRQLKIQQIPHRKSDLLLEIKIY